MLIFGGVLLTYTTHLGLSWISESTCHGSAFALFLRNAEVQFEAVVAVFTVPKCLCVVSFFKITSAH